MQGTPNASITDNMRNNVVPERREVRIHCSINVQFVHGSMNDYGICWNLGLHGMYIKYDGSVIQGAPIELSFVISDEYPSLVDAIGRVVWINIAGQHTQKQLPEGFGVEFVKISDDGKATIQKLIDVS